MSLSAIAAAATVFDTIGEVAEDVGMSVAAVTAAVTHHGIASVDDDGRLTMSEAQSMRAARALDWSAS